jgi:acetyl esterase/lipase
MTSRWPLVVGIMTAVMLSVIPDARAQPLEFDVQRAVQFGQHDGVKLTGDLYAPKGPGKYPALVAVHGGGWQLGSAGLYEHWGPYLAQHGYVLFAIDYRLVKDGKNTYPAAVHDVRAAVQFLRGRGEAIKTDPERIGLIGDSAGAHLAALVALAGEKPPFVGAYSGDPYSGVSTRVKVVVGIYGPYDMAAAWNHELVFRPFDKAAEKFLGAPLVENRKLWFEASPLSYVTRDNNQTAFLLAWGTRDVVADPRTQSEAFVLALNQAGFFVRTVVLEGAPHFWVSDPIDETGSFTGFLAPRLLRFLQARL